MANKFNIVEHKTVFQLRFMPELRLMNTLPELLVPVMSEDYKNILTSIGKLMIVDSGNHRGYAAEIGMFSYLQDSPDSLLAKEGIDNLCDVILSTSKIEQCTRFGYLKRFTSSVDLLGISFNDLVKIMDVKLLSQDTALKKVLPTTKDVLYRVDVIDESEEIHLTIGPTQKEQLIKLIQFNSNFFDDENGQREYLRVIESLPETSIFFEIDFYREAETLPVAEVKPFRVRSEVRTKEITQGLLEYILEGA